MAFIGKKLKIIVFILSFILILCVGIWVLFNVFLDFCPEPIKQINHTRAKVLYHTDHKELLRICREKLAAYNKTISDDKSSNEESPFNSQTSPDGYQKQIDSNEESGPGFGPIEDTPRKTYMRILDLKITFVTITRRWIDLELCTGFYSVSVMAFPEGIEGYGDLKLIDGLWYNDAGFRNDPNFSDYLEKLKDYDIKK